jgi:glycosyltransferase involved in cell wall biosynthesis
MGTVIAEPPEHVEVSVLNVVVTIPEAHVGGAERAGLRFGDALAAHTTVDTVMMEGEGDTELFDDLGLSEPVFPIPTYTVARDSFEGLVGSSNNIWNTLIGTRLTPPRPLSEYDLVHIHNAVPLAGMAAVALHCRLKGIPYCVTTHGISKIPKIPEELGLSRPQRLVFEQVFLRVYKLILSNADHLFALSKGDEDQINEWFPGQSVSVLPNGVDLNQSTEKRTATSEDGESGKPVLLFVGRIMASKGVDDLLEAFGHLDHDCKLVIVGPIRDEHYRDKIDGLGKDVEYRGYVDQQTLNHLYRDADLFVFPTRSDVFPLVTLEAMAAGTPVVSTTVGGLPEQVPETAGLLVPPKQPQEFAEAVDELLSDETRRAEMGVKGRELVREKYSWDAVAAEAVKEYQRMLMKI